MKQKAAQAASDSRLWQRLLLVALTGAVPMFVVSVVLINESYSKTIDFGLQEQRGVLFQRRLARVLELLLPYTAAAEKVTVEGPASADLVAARSDLDAAVQALASDHAGELGDQLHFREAALRARGRDDASLPNLQKRWQNLQTAPPSPAAVADRTRQLVASLRAMIEHNADSSNLILDQDLDSYYLMDIALVALPQAQQRLFDVRASIDWRLGGAEVTANAGRIAILAALLREADLARIRRDAQTSLREDATFNGPSASLQQRLPPAVAGYVDATNRLFPLLERLAAGEAVARADFEGASAVMGAASANLSRVSVDELDRLLGIRLSTLKNERLSAYALIIATLLAAAGTMGWLIRGLLKARYAEIWRAQDELKAKEEQLRALGDNLPGGVTYQVMRELDGSMRFLYVSAGVEALHGVSAEAVLANASELYGLLLEEDRATLAAAEQTSFENKTPFRVLARSRRKSDGAVRWLEFASAPRDLPDGRVIWDGIQLDVTERHLAEAASRQTQQRFSHIFDDSPIAISLSSFSDGRLVDVNSSFLRVSGYSRDEVIGHTALDLGLYEDPEQRAPIMERLRAGQRVDGAELLLRTKAGEVRDSLAWIVVITIGAAEYVLSMFLDVTEQNAATRHERELEEQLRQTQKLEALGTLAGGIAHDFNNILGAVVSFSELSKLDNPDNQELNENLDQVLNASNRATALVRQILSFSRQQRAERKSLQLGPIVKEALSLLRATLPSTIALEHQLDAAVPDVLANATQVHQIVMNLCTNAGHAMRGRQGRIDVELTTLELDASRPTPHVMLKPGSYVLLTISDTGHGMDAATQARIFEPFFTTKSANEGTGLGLSVVHGIVKEYGGAIVVDSEVGRGTTFSIYLPACSPGEARTTERQSEAPRGRGQHVLVVDDEAMLGTAVGKMLERLGYQATVFRSSVEALASFRLNPSGYAALITDYTMPGLTGIELIREIRKIRPELPVILASGSSGPLSPDEVRAAGVSEFQAKPLSLATLARTLQRILT
jgi:PAS domain S-box-containing protein